MDTSCVNLSAEYGAVYRVTLDPAYDTKHVPRTKLDPWYMQVPCKYGTIYPMGGTKLSVGINQQQGIAAQISRIPGVSCTQNDHYKRTYVFKVEISEQVAAIVHPKKRRVLSPERRETLLAASRPFGSNASLRPL